MSIILLGCLLVPKSKPTSSATLELTRPALLPLTTDLPTATMMPSPSDLLTIPTLEGGEAYLLLQHFLKNEPPCQLPCWGGVTPGVSKVSDAEKSFARLSGISSSEFTFFGKVGDSWSVGNLDINYPLENSGVHIVQDFLARSSNETITLLAIDAPYSNSQGFSYQEYNDLLSAYTMPEILATYGVPNLIFSRADINSAEPSVTDFFIIRLLYLDLGIFVSYTIPMETRENTFRFCPSESFISLKLTPQDIGDNYQEFFQQLGNEEWASIPYASHDKSIQEALGLTNEDFVQLIISVHDTCFESPVSIWSQP